MMIDAPVKETRTREAWRIVVRGRVQGVGFRAWACREAQELGLDGWVRNRDNGTVEILAIGPVEKLDVLEAACRRGPVAANVTAVLRSTAQDDGSTGFAQRSTL